MKKIYTLCLGILIAFSTSSQVVIEWAKSFGGSGSDEGSSLLQTLDGGFIVIGSTLSSDGDVVGNNGSSDMWILKLDDSGNLQWQKTLGGTGYDGGYSIKQTNDGGFVAAGVSSTPDGNVSSNNGGNDYWIVRLDYLGNIIWEKSYGGSDPDIAYDIQETMDGSFVVAGVTYSNNGDVTGNNGISAYWIVKLDNMGNLIWQKTFGGSNEAEAYSILETNDGGYIINGRTNSSDGDVTGLIGGFDFWVVKIDSSGILQWQKPLGSLNPSDQGRKLLQTSDGGYIANGWTGQNSGNVTGNHGLQDYWIVKMDSIGNIIWQKSFGGTWDENSYDIKLTVDGGFISVGRASSNNGDVTINYGSSDVWIIKIDSVGNLEWQKSLGGSSYEQGFAIVETNDGFAFTGFSYSSDGDVTSNQGQTDLWIVKLTTEFNSITGTAFIDLNNNTIQDIGENSLFNKTFLETNSGRIAISDVNGFFNISVLDTGNFAVSPSLLAHYTAVPTSHSAYFSALNQTDSLNNFAFQPNGVINDLQVTINPVGAFRPGYDAHYNIHYKNVGTTSISGSVIFKPDSILSYISSLITPTSVTADSVVWNITTLNPFDEGNILVTVNVSTGTVLGSTVNSIARIEPVAGDAIPADNESTWPVTVTGSYDPNDILVNRETVTTTELVSPPYLDYLIRFQNTGTDTAFTVKIKNPLPVNAQLNTFEFLESSHPVQLNYSNPEQLMWFQFDNILLPDSNTNELLSHGYVRYRVKPRSTLIVGDLLENSASIFFDFNAPIYTNTAVTEIVLPSSVPGIKNNFDFSIFPNPTTGEVNISFTLKEEKEIKMELYNSLGQVVKTISQQKFTTGKNQINFSTENITNGIYHIKFSVDDNVVTRKLVKM